MEIQAPQALGIGEMDTLLDLVNRVFDPEHRRMGLYFPLLFCEGNRDDLRVIKVEGRPVSHVGVKIWDLVLGPVRLTAGCVGAVCTDPEYRQQGFAQALVRDAIRHCRAKGVDLLYVSGDRSLYRRHGCARCGAVERFCVPAAAAEEWRRSGVEVVPFQPDHLQHWVDLHQLEPVRFHRPRRDWLRLMTPTPLPHLFGGETCHLTVLQNGEPLAWVVVFTRENRGRVVEMAGARSLVAAGVREAIRLHRLESLAWGLPWHEAEARALCRHAGLQSAWEANEGTVAILNWSRIGDRLRPWLEERLDAEGARRLVFVDEERGGALRCDDEELRLQAWDDLARLLFGGAPGETQATLPDGFWKDVVQRAFPLPRPRYGLSFI